MRARALVKAGRYEAAAGAYRDALGCEPKNWMLTDEVARFLTFSLQEPAAGLDMSRAGLALNPTCSADLWDTAGDALFCLGRVDEARDAFLRALAINPNDVPRGTTSSAFMPTEMRALRRWPLSPRASRSTRRARIATVSSKSRPKCWDSSPSATSRRGISCSTACGSWEARKEATSQDLEVRSQELELRSLKLAGEVPATGSYPCRITAIQMV